MRSAYPTRDMIRRGWLRSSEDPKVEWSQLLRFFEINSLEERPKLTHGFAAKRSKSENEELSPIQTAWVYRVKHIADAMQVPRYSEKSLRNALSELKDFRVAPEEIRRIPRLLESCGVRYVIVEHLPSSKIDGVTFWINDKFLSP